jgi:hypothetical protein
VKKRRLPSLIAAVASAAVLSGCGGTVHTGGTTAATVAPSTTSARTTTTSSSPPANALQGEANAAATGDIPDNQVFLSHRDAAARWSMKYPEGWAQLGMGARVTFRDKNNIVRVIVSNGPRPTAASIRRDLAKLVGAHVQNGASPFALPAEQAFKVVYTTQSAPSPVTGRRVTLLVDRYYVWRHNRLAVVDLGTPVGVDNVDAYRLMIESFRWT